MTLIRRILSTLLLCACTLWAHGAVWQWSAQVPGYVSPETGKAPRAFLWIPEDCRQVRAVVVGMHNMSEEGIFEHPTFRKQMSRLGVAELWITPGLDMLFDPASGSMEALDGVLAALASASGYGEVATAPIVPIGHSAYATWPWSFAAWHPDRTLALLSVHGDAPQTNLTGCGRPNLDWGGRSTDGVPGLMVMAEFEWWEDRLDPIFPYMEKHPKAPVSFFADPGRGHFDHSDQLVDYLAQFIAAAVRYRLPEKGGALKPVDPASGWLADRWRKDSLPNAQAAPYARYQGDRSEAFWYFDRAMARTTEKCYASVRGKEECFIGITQHGKLLTYVEKLHARYAVPFRPGEDGLTFSVGAAYTTDEQRSERLDPQPGPGIMIDRICGPVEKVNDTTFRVSFYRMGLDNPRRTGDIWLLAHADGGKEYKSAVQQLNIRIPYPLTEGRPQTIDFPQPADVMAGTKSVRLAASSDSGMKVSFYVKEGPAEVEGDILNFTAIPPRAKFPVKVTVAAWQYGRTQGEKVQTAHAVERSFYITE